jgi:azurin
MSVRSSLAALTALLVVAAAPATTLAGQKPAAAAPRVVVITGSDDMKFAPTTITAKRGEKLRITLKSVGTLPKIAMAHNFVLLKKGVDAAKVSTASAAARATDFLAPDQKSNLMAFTSLAGPGESVSVDFTVPAVPGQYEFICTFPGHFQAGMKGVLTVK